MTDEQKKHSLENTKSQMRKGSLEFCILLVIGKSKKMYTSDILKELKKTNLIVVEGTLYPLLNRLKLEGLLDYTWLESKNGPPRKYYFITPEGHEAIKNLKTTWEELSQTIHSLIQHYHA